jgi:hypothetical protein
MSSRSCDSWAPFPEAPEDRATEVVLTGDVRRQPHLQARVAQFSLAVAYASGVTVL